VIIDCGVKTTFSLFYKKPNHLVIKTKVCFCFHSLFGLTSQITLPTLSRISEPRADSLTSTNKPSRSPIDLRFCLIDSFQLSDDDDDDETVAAPVAAFDDDAPLFKRVCKTSMQLFSAFDSALL
jgi:hypothetical protein